MKIYNKLVAKIRKNKTKDGTSLREQDREKYLKLLNYSVKLSDHVHWQQNNDDLNIMFIFPLQHCFANSASLDKICLF